MFCSDPLLLRCPSCASAGPSSFYELGHVPAHDALLMPDRESALADARGDIRLAFCPSCGFIFNASFDPQLQAYAPGYEGTQAFSPTFSAFAQRLASDLIARYNLHGKDILEIGCGMGEFLTLLCQIGNNRGVGFDPAYAPGTGTPEPGGLDWRQVTGLLRKVCAKRQVIGADIVEVRPIPPNHVTEFAAARLAYKIIAYTQP